MIITVSGVKKEVRNSLTIAELTELERVKTPMHVTVSINSEFVRSQDFQTYKLQDGDNVDFLYFMGGGA